jgi:hypothetical protein
VTDLSHAIHNSHAAFALKTPELPEGLVADGDCPCASCVVVRECMRVFGNGHVMAEIKPNGTVRLRSSAWDDKDHVLWPEHALPRLRAIEPPLHKRGAPLLWKDLDAFPRVTKYAISMRQPWCWLCIHGGKDLENRDSSFKFRGEALLHASRNIDTDYYDDAVEFVRRELGSELANRIPHPDRIQRGGFVGRTTIVDGFGYSPLAPHPKASSPWYMGAHALVLDGTVETPFYPWPGMVSVPFPVPWPLFDAPPKVKRRKKERRHVR